MKKQSNSYYSVIVPTYNEEKNVAKLHDEIIKVLRSLNKPFEVIFVDDASTDRTSEVLHQLSPITIVKLRKNSGQSAALDAGIKQSSGKVLITMDGDGQNDPLDIPKLIDKLNEGFEAVCGWRYKRKDSFSKRFISKGARFLRKFLVDDGIHDSGCTLRVYKRECFNDLDLYGELHRMIPALLRWRGFNITEIKVNHRSRIHGVSKYNWKRTIKGFLDMLYVWFWRKYSARPLHLFGGLGFILVFTGILGLVILMSLRLFKGYSLSDKIWPLVSLMLIIVGVQLIVGGLMAAQTVELSKQKKYFVRNVFVK